MLRFVQGIPAQFLVRGDVVDDGDALRHDGGAVRAHWPREPTVMAKTVAAGFCADDDEVEVGRN